MDRQPGQASQEIREVEREARRALREVRQAVTAFRQPTLRGELEGARQLLTAAGIECEVEDTAQALPSAVDSVLAWAVREGVTNVIRHSRARHCILRVTVVHSSTTIELSDDGQPVERPDEGTSVPGSGLSGLADRVTAVGGQLAAGVRAADGQRGFRLWVSVPITGSPEQPA